MLQYTGQFALVNAKRGFVPWAIKFITNSPVNHVIQGINETQVLSCEPGGAVIRDRTDFPDAQWSHFDLPDEHLEEIAKFWSDRVGIAYGFFTDAAIGIARIFHTRIPRWIENYISSDYVYECAEMAWAGYRAAGHDLSEDVGQDLLAGEVYPGTYVPLFKARGWWKPEVPAKYRPTDITGEANGSAQLA